MDKREVIKSIDKNRISRVIFNFPELMTDDSEEKIKEEYYSLVELEKNLQEARDNVRRLEREYEERKRSFSQKSSLFTLEFETIEKEHIIHDTSIALQGMGNDIIGKQY